MGYRLSEVYRRIGQIRYCFLATSTITRRYTGPVPPATKTAATDFPAVFLALKRILQKHQGSKLAVLADKPDSYSLETVSTSYRGKPLYFGGIQIRKNSVNFYLMPVYGYKPLLEGMSPTLKKRMQGKACFNFTTVDRELFQELSKLVDDGFQAFKRAKIL